MGTPKVYVVCDRDCKYEGMTKEQIYAAIMQAIETGNIGNIDTGFVTRIKETNGGKNITFWVGSQAQYNALTEKDANCMYIITDETSMVDLVYPVGSVYMSMNDVDPAKLFGGTWERLKDCFLLGASDKYAAGATGGAETHTLTEEEMPSHAHTRGTMEITGSLTFNDNVNNTGVDAEAVCSGAFIANNAKVASAGLAPDYEADWNGWDGFNFKASKSWTGETSYVGAGKPHDNMPPYLAVYMWKRIA